MSEFFKDLSLIVGLRNVRFQVFMAVSMKVTAFWDIVTRRLVAVDRHFKRCILPPGPDDGGSTSEISIYFNEHGAISQKAACHLKFKKCLISIIISMSISITANYLFINLFICLFHFW
jgi:hypothetical protein